MLQRRALVPIALLGLLSAACFSEAPQDTSTGTEPTSSAATTTVSTSLDTSADATADTTAGDPLAACRACQADSCQAYSQTCAGTPDCDNCVDAPYDLGCLTSDAFRPLAFCSCDQCADECGYMCPGGGDACQRCALDAEDVCDQDPCADTIECLPCLEDPYRDGCAENATFAELQTCICGECESPCVWQCEGAVTTCAGCLTGNGACSAAFTNCLGEPACDACFANPASADCAENMLYQSLDLCVCGNCPTECGLLFGCG